MLDSMDFRAAASQRDLPEPGSNRGYAPAQLVEQLLVSIWCGACRFTHLDITRLDNTLTRLFGWTRAAGHKAIARLTQSLQQAIIRDARWFALETGLELAEITYQAGSWGTARRIAVARQSIKRKNAPGKTLSLFADGPDIQGWRYDGDQPEFACGENMARLSWTGGL